MPRGRKKKEIEPEVTVSIEESAEVVAEPSEVKTEAAPAAKAGTIVMVKQFASEEMQKLCGRIEVSADEVEDRERRGWVKA